MPNTNRPKEVADALEEFIDQRNFHSFEGIRGIERFKTVVAQMNPEYHSLEAFLEDNSGAITAMLEWIGTQRQSEWIEGLTQ